MDRTSGRLAAEQADKARTATEMRDYWIREARREGSSFRAIADLTGLSHTAVKKIVDREQRCSPENPCPAEDSAHLLAYGECWWMGEGDLAPQGRRVGR